MNKETIVKTCKCGGKHYFTNCYNEVYDKQKELIDKIKEQLKNNISVHEDEIWDLIKEYEDE